MNDLLTTRQLMDLLHLDRTTIYRMLNEGRLPAVRVGGQWRFQRQALDHWLGGPDTKTAARLDAERMALSPTEILPTYCLQSIQEVFAQTSEVGAVTTDLNGKPLISVSNSCAFCNLILATEQGRARCEASWEKLADRSRGQPRLEKCHAGLTYARGRIVVQDQFVAMVFVGQFVVADSQRRRAHTDLALAKACGIDPQALRRAAATIRVLPRARAERLLALLQMVADTYSHVGEERLDLLNRLKQVAEIAGGPAS